MSDIYIYIDLCDTSLMFVCAASLLHQEKRSSLLENLPTVPESPLSAVPSTAFDLVSPSKFADDVPSTPSF